jgi:hypothetical protein
VVRGLHVTKELQKYELKITEIRKNQKNQKKQTTQIRKWNAVVMSRWSL